MSRSGNSTSSSATTRKKGDKRWTILTAAAGSHETEAASGRVSASRSSAARAQASERFAGPGVENGPPL
jgi:hypothetical protein